MTRCNDDEYTLSMCKSDHFICYKNHRTHNSLTISQHSLFRIFLHHPISSGQINDIVHHNNSPYIDHNANNIILIIAGCETFWSGYSSLIMSQNITYYSKSIPIYEWLSQMQTQFHSEQPYSNDSGVRDQPSWWYLNIICQNTATWF